MSLKNLTPEEEEILEKQAEEEFARQEEERKKDSEDYWKWALNVVNDWAKYNAAKKLYINATHEETKHKVQDVVKDYYDGRNAKVKDRENELSYNVTLSIDMFQSLCAQNRVEPITRDWLYHNLRESNDYEKIRGKIERRRAKFVDPVSLKYLV